MVRGNLRPASWRTCTGWEVTRHAMTSAVSSCLVLRDLVHCADPSSVGYYFVTGAGTLIRIRFRVEMGAGVGCCGVPWITFGA